MRPYPQNWQRSKNDWNHFPDESIDHRPTKRNHFANIYLRSLEDLDDDNVSMAQIGYKKQVVDSRNGLGKRSEGDKSYHTVEYSPDFHKLGSTLPSVHFGRAKQTHGHKRNRVPMKNEKISIVDHETFERKVHQQEYEQTIDEVVKLDHWKPAESITSAFQVFDRDSSDQHSGKYRPRVR
jgi:hypothetical protein